MNDFLRKEHVSKKRVLFAPQQVFFTEPMKFLLFFTHKTTTGGEKINLVERHTTNRKARELK